MKNWIPRKSKNICSHHVFGLLSTFASLVSYRLTQLLEGIPAQWFCQVKNTPQNIAYIAVNFDPAYAGFDWYYFFSPATQLEGSLSDISLHRLWVSINTLFKLLPHPSVSLTAMLAVVLFTSLPSQTAAAMSLCEKQLTLMAGLCYYNPYLMMRFKLASGKLWRAYNSILEPRQPYRALAPVQMLSGFDPPHVI